MRLHRLAALLAATLIIVPVAAGAQDEGGKRVALVIGNSGYKAVPGLGNPSNDARLLAKTLRAKGFTLVGGDARVDLDKAQFNAAVDAFAVALRGADVALFFYAGHGMQVRGANWLVPVDAAPRRAADLDAQMVNAVRVLAAMKAAGTKLNLVLLDACRDNPFPTLQTPGGESALAQTPIASGGTGRGLGVRGGGLAQMQAPEGTVIAFATQPGDVALDGTGGDSPFTLALVQALQLPGLDVLTLFNQVGVAVKHATGGQQQPWISSSPIEGDYFLGEQPAVAGAVPSRMRQQGPMVAGPLVAGMQPRIAAAAAPRGIPVPDVVSVRSSSGLPPDLARFLGAWGPGQWSGRRGTNDFILVVNDVDRTGQAQITLMNSSGCVDPTCSVRAPFIGHASAAIADGALSFRSQRNGHEFAFRPVGDRQLSASQTLGRGLVTTTLARIE